MDIYKYNQVDETYGYSANQVFWTPILSTNDCSNVNLQTQRCAAFDSSSNCVHVEQCLNDILRREKETSHSTNGRYIDSKNNYVRVLLHTLTMSLAVGSILVYGVREMFFSVPIK